MMRQLHRWTSLPLILFLVLILGTGVYLQVEEIGKIGAARPAPAAQAMPDDMAIQQQLATALTKARAAAPDFNATRIELSLNPQKQTTRFATQPRGGPFVEVDHVNGAVKADMNPATPLHVTMIRLHTGQAMGATGVILTLLSSVILLFLALSGAWLYWQMWQNRKSRGHAKLFWK